MTSNSDALSKPWVKEYLSRPLLARLGTTNPRTNQPHVTPVWYEWDGESLWISAFSSTRKVKEVRRNPKIAVLIDSVEDNGPTRGVLMEGTAELITDPAVVSTRATSIYTRYLGPQGVLDKDPQSWIYDPENTIIRLMPERIFVWG